MFGPITGDDRAVTFTTYCPVTAAWNSYFHLYQAATTATIHRCGGSVTPLSRLTGTLTNGLTYWLML
ncbi:hypothetical protein HaLaN_06209 [Haematococcus lacustris]|uniref:Uncharacterized protein n=1 Tax=Haematococcus lacustris TaxID=44745 RepID=A0A699YL53_HAELA|nr:hypothetical protein HaLaN_06209 [Haematococcus lacustris]